MIDRELPPIRGSGLGALRAAVAWSEVSAPEVSGWSVGMHVHHCGLSMTGVCRLLLRSHSPPPRPRPTAMGSLLLLFGRIPRGRAKAPEIAAPAPDVPAAELHALLDRSEEMLTQVRDLPPGAWFEHFSLGVFRRDQAVRFLGIHNRHHLRIIRDILAAR